MDIASLKNQIKTKKSYLTVGLDTDVEKLPKGIPRTAEGILLFHKKIIAATQHVAVAFKINTAFYEVMGAEGWNIIQKTREMIPSDCLSIADAKRGDIGNTSKMYAKAFFETLGYDAVTVAPYMGQDSVAPFLDFENKITIVLGLTSNEGSRDFQTNDENKTLLYEQVLRKVSTWGTTDNLMFVIGATKADKLKELRTLLPYHFFLVPGVGAQGGDVSEVCKYGQTDEKSGLLINSSRGIIYASSEEDFEAAAAQQAEELASDMSKYF